MRASFVRALPARLFARFLGVHSSFWVRSERSKLELLLACLPKPKAFERQAGKGAASPKVLVVIPFRDKWQLTQQCVASLLKQDFVALELKVILVDNGSVEDITLESIAQWKRLLQQRGIQCQVLEDSSPFNFSNLNNKAAALGCADFDAELLLFLNNDVEFVDSTGLNTWVNWHHVCATVGVSGATLFYPNRTIQHACVLPGFKIVATHPLRHCTEQVALEWSSSARCVPAVTGAAFMIRRSLFETLGGFDIELAHACQDVDLCLKCLEKGYDNWVVPKVTLIHHESATRKSEHKPSEVAYFYERWEARVEQLCGMSKRLSRWTETPCISLGEGAFPWRKFSK